MGNSINWENEVNLREEELMADLKELLKIDSVRDVDHKTDEFPLGPGPAEALAKFLEFGKRDGFVTKNIENVAGHVDFGEGDEVLGVLGHVDVVPTGDGWDTNPFEPVIKDGKLFARGSLDDKGPLIAAYYGLKIIKDLKLPTTKKVRFIVGTDEESAWYCMDRYQANEVMPDFGFSPDAYFPIINGEKGIGSFDISFSSEGIKDGDITLVSFNSGIRANMVPGDATAVLNGKEDSLKELEESFKLYLEKNNLKGSFDQSAEEATFSLIGKPAHAQNPVAGVNAATYLADFLNATNFDTQGKEFLNGIATYLHLDPQGKLTKIACTDDVMGKLTSSPNIFVYEINGEKKITINIRFPKGTDAETIIKELEKNIPNVQVTAQEGIKGPHYVPVNDPLVQALLGSYEDHTGEKATEKTIGGGTYGRLFERGVAFGALFPGREDVMHQANEFMHVEDIYKATVIYADAIYRLIK